MEKKYGKVLTIVLIIVVIAVLILICFLGIDVIKRFTHKNTQTDILNQYENMTDHTENKEENVLENIEIPMLNEEPRNNGNTSTGGDKKITYKGYSVVGRIEIPTINLSYVILDKATPSSIEASVAVSYGPGPNKIGNTVIVGHNYRNGSFFGNNDKLQIGDKVYITDNSGTKIKYNIYNIYETSPDEGDYMVRDTNGIREISLSTCTDNSKARLIIWAVEEN